MNVISENPLSHLSKTAVYHPRNVLGRFWSKITAIKDRANRGAQNTRDLALDLLRIKLMQLEGDLDLYKDHLIRKNISKSDLQLAVKRLIIASELTFHQMFNQHSVFKEARRAREVIEIELITGKAWPLELLSKLICREKLNAKEERELSLWLEPLNQKVIGASAATLHLALLYLIKEGILGDQDIKCLGLLEDRLEQKGCKILSRGCKAHYHLQKASRIYCNGQEYRISNIADRLSLFQTFNLKEEPKKRALVGINPASVHIYQHQHKEPWGLKTPHIYEVDEKGECAIIENLDHPVAKHAWSYPLSKEDYNTAEPLIEFLKLCLKDKRCPKENFAHLLHFTEDVGLKTQEKLTNAPFNFNHLEEGIRSLCGDHQELYRHLMKQSGLKKHPVNHFYEDMVKKSLNQSKPINFTDEAYIKGFKEKAISQRAEYLCQQASGLVQRCHQQTRIPKEEIQKKLLAKASDNVGWIEKLEASDVI